MSVSTAHRLWLLCCAAAGPAWCETPSSEAAQTHSTELVWSLGMQLKVDDLSRHGPASWRPMIGLRYGRWRSGAVDGESWHRFGQVRPDNTLTYDWLDSAHWRTSLSAGIVNMQRDATFDAFLPGRKTLRGKASIDYLGWSHWSAGLVLTQDLLGRGAGTSLSPSITYRQALSEDSTILLSQGLSFARSELWRYQQPADTPLPIGARSRWSASADTSLTLRQRWMPHWSWFAQLGHSRVFRTGDPFAHTGSSWSGQAGVIYFER